MTRRLGIFVISVAAVLAALCTVWGEDPLIKRFGDEGVELLLKPEKVKAYRLRPTASESDIHVGRSVDEYPIVGESVAIPALTTEQLIALLSQPERELAKACIPAPGVRLDFIRGSETLQVLLCFECKILIVYQDGKLVGGGDFDSSYVDLLRAVKAIFPNDPEIQALKEDR
jgi:hypothetical protein